MLKDLHEKMQQLKNEMKIAAYGEFKAGARELFDKYPKLESFSWTQFTQYYCDGDPCYFSANTEWGVEINGVDGEDTTPVGLKELNEIGEGAVESVRVFLKQFTDDDYEMLFGDNARIIVKPNEIEVEEYSDHD